MLTPEQLAHFETFGFIVIRQVFSEEEVGSIRDEFDEVLDEERGNQPFEAKERQAVSPFVEKRAALTSLLEDDRLYRLHEDLLGPGFQWISSDGNLFVGDTSWHTDRDFDEVEYGYKRIKTTLYLDPVTRDTGCLRIILGSHRQALHESLFPLRDKYDGPGETPFGSAGADLPGFPIESQPGDVVVFNQLCWHSSFGGEAGRRLLALSMISAPSTEEQVAYLREKHATWVVGYHPAKSWIESDRPRIRGMVSKLVELGFKPLDV